MGTKVGSTHLSAWEQGRGQGSAMKTGCEHQTKAVAVAVAVAEAVAVAVAVDSWNR
jgi:hypothetical protein